MTDVLSQLNSRAEKAKETVSSLISKVVEENLHPFINNNDLYIYKSGVYDIQTKKVCLVN